MSIRGDILRELESQALAVVDNPAGYPLAPVRVEHFAGPLQVEGNERFPALFIVDTGEEELLARDATHYFYRTSLIVAGAVKVSTGGDLQEQGNAMLATVKQFVDAISSLGTGYRDLQQSGRGNVEYGPDAGIAIATINLQLLYACAAGSF